MGKVTGAIKWIISNLFFITIAIFIGIYLRWFRLTPLMFYNDPDGAYIVGLILLGLYSLFAFLIKLSKNRRFLKRFLFFPTAIFLLGNITHANAFFPSLEFASKCNGKTYYITWMHPFGDYQWIFNNVTIWKGVKYESFFFGYSSSSYEIVCDEDKKEANIINISNDVLAYTDGENSRIYDEYNGAILGNHQYFLSRECNDWVPSTCGSLTYTLFECNLSYKSCDPVPIKYTLYDSRNFLNLVSDSSTNEVNLYEEYFETDDEILIFTYGQHPRCYVAGCEILEL
ncbi:MAG: alkaline shock response membrane anchor protein AmaP [Anaerolineae bacterium]|nr:alkaline shock response membrane anchor protein AmaP [Anaerolineae bacterium]MCI0609136.1 alkaline shock response membrane anchor protein AmaP [Anaerolineae bacterium]